MKLKALSLVACFLLLQIPGYSQIKFEASQPDNLKALEMDNGEKIFASYQQSENTVVLYRSDYSEWKIIPVDLARKQQFDELKSVSVNVFNTDPLIELAYTSLEYISNYDTEVSTDHVSEKYTLYIVNEKGSMLMEEKDGFHMEVIDTYGTRKLWVYKQSDRENKSKDRVDVYSLPDAPVADLKIDPGKNSEYRAAEDQQ